jgi:signal peptidase II
MTRRRGHLLFWLGVIGGLSADLISKHCVFQCLSRHDGPYDVWPGVFRLSPHTNTGGPFSILDGHNYLLVTVIFFALIVIGYLYWIGVRQGRPLALAGLSLITAGAVGNLVDRLSGGEVRDFLDFYIISYPVFNVADILIVVGAVAYGIEVLRRDAKTPKAEASGGGAPRG